MSRACGDWRTQRPQLHMFLNNPQGFRSTVIICPICTSPSSPPHLRLSFSSFPLFTRPCCVIFLHLRSVFLFHHAPVCVSSLIYLSTVHPPLLSLFPFFSPLQPVVIILSLALFPVVSPLHPSSFIPFTWTLSLSLSSAPMFLLFCTVFLLSRGCAVTNYPCQHNFPLLTHQAMVDAGLPRATALSSICSGRVIYIH